MGGKFMKKWNILLAAGILILSCTACGKQEVEIVTPPENDTVNEVQEEGAPAETESAEKNDNFEDLEEKSDNGEVAAFAEKIQTAAANKDMEALAGLCSYPLAVNGEVVENKEAFMALGEDVIFTEERCAVIADTDITALEETMAGVIMGDATPNIIFKSVDGTLGITGIN